MSCGGRTLAACLFCFWRCAPFRDSEQMTREHDHFHSFRYFHAHVAMAVGVFVAADRPGE